MAAANLLRRATTLLPADSVERLELLLPYAYALGDGTAARSRRLQRLVECRHQVGGDLFRTDFVSQQPGESLDRALRVVLRPVEPVVDDALDASEQRPERGCGGEGRGSHGEGARGPGEQA